MTHVSFWKYDEVDRLTQSDQAKNPWVIVKG